MVLSDISNRQSDKFPSGKTTPKTSRKPEQTPDIQFYDIQLAEAVPPLVPDFREVFCSASPTKAWTCRLCKHHNVTDVKDHLPKHQRRTDRGLNFLSIRYHNGMYSFVPYYANCSKQYSTPLNLFVDRPSRTYENQHHELDNAIEESDISWTDDKLEFDKEVSESYCPDVSKMKNIMSLDKSLNVQEITEDFLESRTCHAGYDAGHSIGTENSTVECNDEHQSQNDADHIMDTENSTVECNDDQQSPTEETDKARNMEMLEIHSSIGNLEKDDLLALEPINQFMDLVERDADKIARAQQAVQSKETTECETSVFLGHSAAEKSEQIVVEFSLQGKFEKGHENDDTFEAHDENQNGIHFLGETPTAEPQNVEPAEDGKLLGIVPNIDTPNDSRHQDFQIEEPENLSVGHNPLTVLTGDDESVFEEMSNDNDKSSVNRGEKMSSLEEIRKNTGSQSSRPSLKQLIAMEHIKLSSLSDFRFKFVQQSSNDKWICTLCNISSLSVFSVVEHCQGKKHTKLCDAMLPGTEPKIEKRIKKLPSAFSEGESNRLSYADVVKKIQIISEHMKPSEGVFQGKEILQTIRNANNIPPTLEYSVTSPAPVSEDSTAEDLDDEEKTLLRQLLLERTPLSYLEALTKKPIETCKQESQMFPDTPFNSPIAQSSMHVSPSFSALLDAIVDHITEKEGSHYVNHDDTNVGIVSQLDNGEKYLTSEETLNRNIEENDLLAHETTIEYETARKCIAALAYFELLTPKSSTRSIN
jgi:hypothetical protein